MRPVTILLLVFCGALLALLTVCALRAARLKKTLAGKSPAVSWTKAEADLYADRLCRMIRIPTVSKKQTEDWPQFRLLQEEMARLFPRVFAESERHDVDGNILRRIPGLAPERGGTLLMGHQDVVPADQKEWTTEPFAGIVKDGCVWGRGAMDCKSTLCCEFSAVEELLEAGFRPKEDLWLFSSRNEENSGGGAEAAVAYLRDHGYRLNVVLDEGGAVIDGVFPGLKHPCAAVGLVEKGFCNVRFTARGEGGHASTPPKNTPLVRLSAFIAAADKKRLFRRALHSPVTEMFAAITPYLPFYFRFVLGNLWLFRPLVTAVLPLFSPMAGAFVSTTAAFTMCGGSPAPNVLPDEAWAIANVRPSPHQNAEKSIEQLKTLAEKYNVQTEVLMARDASGVTDPNGAEFRFLTDCLSEVFTDAIPTPYLMTGGTDSRQFEAICPNVLRISATRLTKSQLDAMHAANESIGVEALAEGVKFYRHYLERMNKR